MSVNYVVSRIKEALYNAKGNKKLATKQIMAWALQDTELLQGLTRAHLGGIVAYHIDRVASGRADSAPSKPAANASAKAAASQQRKTVNPARGTPFAQEILKNVSNPNAPIFGLESYAAPTQSNAATSKRHKDALTHIASFSHTKKK